MKRISPVDFSPVRQKRLLVALSGGADSVALLHLLADARESMHLALVAAHIDHCIRGDESRADAEFCREMCQALNIEFHLRRIDVPAAARASGEGLETAARRLRYEALRQCKCESQCDFIALAHHLDDQAETVLMHLLRGCGSEGIGGMREIDGDLYRPLLNVPKSALTQFLTERSIPWREDRTNAEAFTPRNALRLHALPILEEIYPSAAAAIGRYAEAAQCDNRLLESLAERFLAEHLECGPYGTRIVRPETADEAVLRRCIRRICGAELSHEKLLELIALGKKNRGKLEISKTMLAERTPNALYFLPKERVLPEPVPLQNGASLEGLGRISIREGRAEPIRGEPFRQMMRRDAFENAVLRTRRDGDHIRPLGCGDRLLSDYLTDKKIDRPLRDSLPLIAVGNRVLWVVGAGIAEEAKITSSSDDALLFEWIPDRI